MIVVFSFLHNSFCCGLLVLLFLALRSIFKKQVSHSIFYVIELMNMVLFSFPFSILLPKQYYNSDTLPKAEKTIIPQMNMSSSIEKQITSIETFFSSDTILNIMTVIWLYISVAIIVILLLRHIAMVRKISRWTVPCSLSEGEFLTNRTFICLILSTPIILKFFKPILLLPKNVDSKELSYILNHEMFHLKRHDPLIKLIATIITAFNWFNPCSWLLLKMITTECELSCDELAVKNYSKDKRLQYAELLIDHAKKQNHIFYSFAQGFSKDAKILRERLIIIMDGKNKKIKASILLVGMISVALCGFTAVAGTAPIKGKSSPESVIEKYVCDPEYNQDLAVIPFLNPEVIERTELISIERTDVKFANLQKYNYTDSFSESKAFMVKYVVDYKDEYENMMTEPSGEKEKIFVLLDIGNYWIIDSVGY